MKDGKIVQSGKYSDLLQQGSHFAALSAAHDSSMALMESAEPGAERNSRNSSTSNTSSLALAEAEPDAQKRLVKDEERATGHVSLAVYKHYVTAAWGWCWPCRRRGRPRSPPAITGWPMRPPLARTPSGSRCSSRCTLLWPPPRWRGGAIFPHRMRRAPHRRQVLLTDSAQHHACAHVLLRHHALRKGPHQGTFCCTTSS